MSAVLVLQSNTSHNFTGTHRAQVSRVPGSLSRHVLSPVTVAAGCLQQLWSHDCLRSIKRPLLEMKHHQRPRGRHADDKVDLQIITDIYQ